MKNVISLILISLAFTGCSTSPEQQIRDEQARQFRIKQHAQHLARQEEERSDKLKKQCVTYGFKPGTTEFSQCLLQVDQQESANRAAWYREQNRQQQQNPMQDFINLGRPPKIGN